MEIAPKEMAHTPQETAHTPKGRAIQMLEHLLAPEFDDVHVMDSIAVLSSQAKTTDWLAQIGSPEHLINSGQKASARAAFVSMTNPAVSDADKKKALLALRVPQAVRHLSNMLSEYDWEFIEQAKEIRGYVVAKLLEETTHPDAKVRLKSLELVGKLTEVGSFMERVTITKVDATSDELTERIKAKLAGLLPKVIEVETVEVKNE